MDIHPTDCASSAAPIVVPYAANDNSFTTRKADGGSWLTCLVRLSEDMPYRSTASQLAFFLAAARYDLAGAPRTYVEIKAEFGPAVNRQFASTYKLFMAEPRKRSDYVSTRPGLGWLYQEPDPADGRRRFLRTTTLGREVLARAFNISVEHIDEGLAGHADGLTARLRVAIEAVFVL